MRRISLLAAVAVCLAVPAAASAAVELHDAGLAEVEDKYSIPSRTASAGVRSRTMTFAQARAFTRELMRLTYLEVDPAWDYGLATRACRRISRTSLHCWGWIDVHDGEPVYDEFGDPVTYGDGEPVYDGDQTCWIHVRWRWVGRRLAGSVYRSHSYCEPWRE